MPPTDARPPCHRRGCKLRSTAARHATTAPQRLTPLPPHASVATRRRARWRVEPTRARVRSR
eukprot:816389-Prymnesium_polylepis.1